MKGGDKERRNRAWGKVRGRVENKKQSSKYKESFIIFVQIIDEETESGLEVKCNLNST